MVFLITDGLPTTAPDPANACTVASGDCECDPDPSKQLLSSLDVYAEIKKANTAQYPNQVVALGFGSQVSEAFLHNVSDTFINTSNFSTSDKEDVVAKITHTVVYHD